MHTMLIKLYVTIQQLSNRVEGQDMVEYALVVGLLCFGATAATKFLAAGLALAFGNISGSVATYTS